MKLKEVLDYLSDWGAKFLIVCCVLCCIFGAMRCCSNKKDAITSSPVEENRIDSIKRENSILIIEVEHLDSIKDVKTIEVKALDNDSTLKLFYELIRK